MSRFNKFSIEQPSLSRDDAAAIAFGLVRGRALQECPNWPGALSPGLFPLEAS